MTTAMSLPEGLSPHDSFFSRMVTALKTLRVLKDEAADAKLAWVLHASLDDRTYEALGRELQNTNEALFTARPTVPARELTLEALAQYPEGSLGRYFSGYFQKNGIFPFTYEFPLQSNADFLYKRFRETHDIHHMLAGYGIDPLGEIEIQAFYVGNLGLKHSSLLCFFGVPYLIIQQRSVRTVLRKLVAAYRRGQRTVNVLTLPYEEMWGEQMSVLRNRYFAVK